jgi:hypothetical protein
MTALFLAMSTWFGSVTIRNAVIRIDQGDLGRFVRVTVKRHLAS